MKVKDYMHALQEIVKTNPLAEDLEVVYAIDDEGNAFKTVNYEPSLISFDEDLEVVEGGTGTVKLVIN